MSRGPVGVVKVVVLIQRCVGSTSASATHRSLTRTCSNPEEPPPDEWPPPARRESGGATRAMTAWRLMSPAMVSLGVAGVARPPIAALVTSQISQPGENASGGMQPAWPILGHAPSHLWSATFPQQPQRASESELPCVRTRLRVVRHSTMQPGCISLGASSEQISVGASSEHLEVRITPFASGVPTNLQQRVSLMPPRSSLMRPARVAQLNSMGAAQCSLSL